MSGRALVGLGLGVALTAGLWTILDGGWAVSADPARESDTGLLGAEGRIRVQVLNAGGVDGLAREATGLLRGEGFDVVYYGDAEAWDRDSTRVIDRVGRPEVAWAVADALGVGRVESAPDPDLFVDVTVLLGTEWKIGIPAGRTDEGPDRLPWWNPRGWLNR